MTGHSKRSVERSRYDNYEAAFAARPVVPSGSAYRHLLAPQTTRAAASDRWHSSWMAAGAPRGRAGAWQAHCGEAEG